MQQNRLNETRNTSAIILSESDHFSFLLMNNSLSPGIILGVKTDKDKFYQLDIDTQLLCFEQINRVSKFISKTFKNPNIQVSVQEKSSQQLPISVVAKILTTSAIANFLGQNCSSLLYTRSQIAEIKLMFDQA